MQISTETFEQAKSVAADWQREIAVSRDRAEKKFHDVMGRMLEDPMNKTFLIELLDQSFRATHSERVADQLEYIFAKYENTEFFTLFEQLLVFLFRRFGVNFPDFSVPLFIRYLRNDISNVVIKGEESPLNAHLGRRRGEGTRVNINIIGEAVLGEEEARERIQKYVRALQNPHIDYISVKISTIFSQINPLAHEWSVEQISKRLETIYTAAMEHPFSDKHGITRHKFVNLDMEEYRDVNLTVDAFMKTLSKEPFTSLHAGIVMQAYLPDAMGQLKKLADWAKERVAEGGAPIKVRLVKGANQEMEQTESSLRGWPSVTYDQKAQTDANYKICMDYLLSPEIAPAVHTGIASHNLFDHALGMLLARERGVTGYYTAEMLEGMSETAYHVLKNEGLEVILYGPTATMQTFTNAIAYLVRRFDENTAEQNFLRHSFGLEVDTPAWDILVKSYEDALAIIDETPQTPYRAQDRNAPVSALEVDTETYVFANESDTDFALPANRRWAEDIRDTWQHVGQNGGYHAHSVIGGEERSSEHRVEVIDKSQYHDGVIVGSYTTADADALEEAVSVASNDPDGWRKLDSKERQKILMNAAQEFRKARGDLIGIAAAEVGKVFTETDVEVSEAIDFLNFYPYSVRKMETYEGIRAEGKGVGLVVSPWNFPVAIPTGGVAAALASGNTVILKPSSDAILCAHRLCQCFWDAGVGKNTLQLVISSGSLAGKHLIPDPAVDFVIFTGGESTAYNMIKSRPDIHLSAETGGKDATIVTALADRDQAVKNVVASAFNNSGQKCSATSLLVLEREVYEDADFRRMLVDTAASLEVGSVWELENRIGTLVRKPSGKLEHALEHLDDGEQWALPPAFAQEGNPYMLKPAIRWGTKAGDYCHMNELFGPVLSVMCAEDLDDAINKVNATGYGLTSGLESLDEREQERWKERLIAGNLYINRGTTGAIVLRQPFGGMRKSAIGSGRKAGGLNYVAQFMRLEHDGRAPTKTAIHPYLGRLEVLLPMAAGFEAATEQALATLGQFAYWLEEEFSREHDYCNIRGESNVIRYLGVKSVLLRFDDRDSLDEMLCSIGAAKMAGAQVYISISPEASSRELMWLGANQRHLLDAEDTFVMENDITLLFAMEKVERIRFLHPERVPPHLYNDIADKALHIAAEPFIPNGRIELLHYFVEQSVTNSYHRYGNLGLRGLINKES